MRLEGVNDRLEVDDLERPYDLVQVELPVLAHPMGLMVQLALSALMEI